MALPPDVNDTERRRLGLQELTYLSRQWLPTDEPPLYGFWMASSEVDQKFLGHFAKTTSIDNNYLSSFLFRVLGLSVLLAHDLVEARQVEQFDLSDPGDAFFVNRILWLAREGLVMVEQYVLPMVGNYVELKVLAYKVRASFYHIFVQFHNNPPVNNRIIRRKRSGARAGNPNASLYPAPLTPRTRSTSSRESQNRRQRSPAVSLGGPVGGGGGGATRNPPGLPIPPNQFKFDGSENMALILPYEDYKPRATNAFAAANSLAESLLPGSHPVRLSVKVEYVAYLYDCLGEREQSRRTARLAIRQVYEAKEGMDDESFEDAAEMVGLLGRMMRRGLVQQPGQQQMITANAATPPPGTKPPTGPLPVPVSQNGKGKHGKAASMGGNGGIKQTQSPGRGRQRGNSVTNSMPINSASNPTTSKPTTWV